MARLQNCIFGGLIVLTLTVVLNTDPAAAANCTDVSACQNSGTCPDPNNAPCDCSASAYIGDTCEDEVCSTNADCNNGGTCDDTSTPNVCSCGDYKGKTCDDACDTNTDCQNSGTCTAGTPNTCSCGDYKGDQCQYACLVSGDCQNGGTCTSNACVCGDYKGDHCEHECLVNADCVKDGDSSNCDTTGTTNKCDCDDTNMKGPGCKEKSGASRMTTFSLMSLCVVLTGYFL